MQGDTKISRGRKRSAQTSGAQTGGAQTGGADAGARCAKRPRGRPRGFRPEAALAAVAEVFARKGYAETTLDDLGAATGLARPSLYAAFGDKEQAYLAALAQYGARVAAASAAALDASGRLSDRLAALFAGAAAFYCRDPSQPGCMIAGTAAAAAPEHPAIREAAARMRAAAVARYKEAFEAAGAWADAQARAEMTLAALESMGLRARLGESETALAQFGRACARRLAGDLDG
jgi:AcrR family transcriptional regulator